jgi:hypothetical protein
MCYLVSRQISETTDQMKSRLLGSIVADTTEDAWRQARLRWPNLDIDVEQLPPPSSTPNGGCDGSQ